MSTKRTDDELLAQLDNLATRARVPASRSAASTTRPSKQAATTSQSEHDILAEFENLAAGRPSGPGSRPATPSLKPGPAQTAGVDGRSPKRSSAATPPIGRSSEEKANNGQRKSGDSMRSFHQAFTPATTIGESGGSPERQPQALGQQQAPHQQQQQQSQPPPQQPQPAARTTGGSSWWGGLLSTASAAVSHAQAAVREIQKNEDAQRWAEQVRGNVGALKGLGKPDRHLHPDLLPLPFSCLVSKGAPANTAIRGLRV